MLRQSAVGCKVSRWITFEQAGHPSATHTERTMPCRCPGRLQRMAEQQPLVFVQRGFLKRPTSSPRLPTEHKQADHCGFHGPIIAPTPSIVVVMQSSFRIFKTLGAGSLYTVDSGTTPQDARQRVEALARFWPSIYIICNGITGEELFIDTTGETKN